MPAFLVWGVFYKYDLGYTPSLTLIHQNQCINGMPFSAAQNLVPAACSRICHCASLLCLVRLLSLALTCPAAFCHTHAYSCSSASPGWPSVVQSHSTSPASHWLSDTSFIMPYITNTPRTHRSFLELPACISLKAWVLSVV